LMFSFVVR